MSICKFINGDYSINYNGNVDKVTEIPCDYDGVMGVPITFLGKFNPDQFEIVGQMANTNITDTNFGYPFVGGKRKYARGNMQEY